MDAVARFAELVGDPGGEVPLDESCIVLAAALRPDVDVAHELSRLDRLADGVPGDTLGDVVDQLFGPEGFDGDHDAYYDADNSLLPRVLDRRRGIPITLAVVTMEVARRRGIPANGIGMPGHFLIGDPLDDGVFIDGFSGGIRLDRTACRRVFGQLHGDDVPWHDAYLEPVGPDAVVARVLANLRQIAAAQGDRSFEARVLELRCQLPGSGVRDRVELANLIAAGGQFIEAADMLDATAEGAESTAEAVRANRLRDHARGLRARLN